MIRPCIAVLTALVIFSVPASAQPARVAELERKVRDLESKVRDAERQRDDAKRGQDDAKRDKDRAQQALQAAEAKLKTAAQQADAVKREKDALSLKALGLEAKLKAAAARADGAEREVDSLKSKPPTPVGPPASDAGERTRLQRERDEQKETASQLLEVARKELLKLPSVKADAKLAERIEKADAKKLLELYPQLPK